MKLIDLTGKKFNRLTVKKYVGKSKWLCLCECGNETIVHRDKLIRGQKSCGCYNREKASETMKKLAKERFTKHGLCTSDIYLRWQAMKRRCKTEHYEKRKINVCGQWKNFEIFYVWAINNGYKKELTLDRIDNNKGYSPDNCRWTSMKVQTNNTSRNKLITYKNETHTLSEWAALIGIKYPTLAGRLNRKKWTVEKTFTYNLKRLKNGKI